MNVAKILGKIVLVLVLAAYAGSFMLLPVIHNHHNNLFSASTVHQPGKTKQSSSHPDDCVVCSRISTSAALISTVDFVPTGMVHVTEVYPDVTPRVLETSSPVLSGRAPPSVSL